MPSMPSPTSRHCRGSSARTRAEERPSLASAAGRARPSIFTWAHRLPVVGVDCDPRSTTLARAPAQVHESTNLPLTVPAGGRTIAARPPFRSEGGPNGATTSQGVDYSAGVGCPDGGRGRRGGDRIPRCAAAGVASDGRPQARLAVVPPKPIPGGPTLPNRAADPRLAARRPHGDAALLAQHPKGLRPRSEHDHRLPWLFRAGVPRRHRDRQRRGDVQPRDAHDRPARVGKR